MDGRWITLDILPNNIYKNNYAFANNSSVISSDRVGLLTVGIDGTNYDVAIHRNLKSNVYEFTQLVDDIALYHGGPGSEIANSEGDYSISDALAIRASNDGPSFSEIRSKVYRYICKHLKYNRKDTINIIGWSRGAVIAVEVAKLLKEEGCCYKTYTTVARSWNPFAEKQFIRKEWCCDRQYNIPVNFLGLFDPVDRAFFNITTSVIPRNVAHNIVLEHNDPEESVMFNTQKYENSNVKKITNLDGSKTDHGDIGGTSGTPNAALNEMISAAKHAGIRFRL